MTSFRTIIDTTLAPDEEGAYDLKLTIDELEESKDTFESAIGAVIYAAALKKSEELAEILKTGDRKRIEDILKETTAYFEDFNSRKSE